MTLDLTDDEKLALVTHLRHLLEHDPFPFALRFDPWKAILAKLEPPAPRPEPLPPVKAGMTPRHRVAPSERVKRQVVAIFGHDDMG